MHILTYMSKLLQGESVQTTSRRLYMTKHHLREESYLTVCPGLQL